MLVGDDGNQEAAAEAQKLQARVREAKQRAIEAKEQQRKQQRQTKEVSHRTSSNCGRRNDALGVVVRWWIFLSF